ncbi:hypothetical protein [Ruegeria marina]|uniref:Argininosuccinate lyase n=1 Tax=Ruegeria marina TaxID=639004 RepID=A0A1G6QM68_9RHOB|nr:hypothetical protein [Ruegeria marina]SDC93134.1 hypothetical protein SAMN04488239_104162 [Ruegeria marina]
MGKSLLLAGIIVTVSSLAAAAQDLEFLLVNESSADVTEFHISIAASNDWEENLIEGGYLAPGYELGIVIADGETTCVYDLRAVFSDGAVLEDYGLDLCEMGSYTFSD